jgi:glycerol uptake facilitator-like aquaporin
MTVESSEHATVATLAQKTTAEFIGTSFLLATVVGSGIMAESLSADPGLVLLQNALATGAVLTAMILALGGVSGAHLNPAVTLGFLAQKQLSSRDTVAYIAAQVAGGVLGVIVANIMFDLDPISLAETTRSGSHLWVAEVVATLGLLLVIYGPIRTGRTASVAFAVGTYIAAAYYFTSSTSFANPAVTVARMLSDTFAGIAPSSVPAFLVAQAAGVALAVVATRFTFSRTG